TWSVDGKRVAFLRFPGTRSETPKDNEPSSWFAILVADAGSGNAKEIWKSSDQTGGFAQFYPDHPLMWGAEDKLLFYWEKDGWIRIYSVDASGGDASPLTPPSCETETATLSPDRSSLIFSSNCNDIERRHLWNVPVQGGKATQLTKGNSVETYPLQPANSKQILFVRSTPRQPASLAKMSSAGGVPQLLDAGMIKGFPMDELVEPEVVKFQAADGLEIHGQLFLPRETQKNKSHPAVIYMHGGPIRQMLPAWHYIGYYHNAYAMNQFLAANGFVVLSVNFRSGIGYGREFRKARGQGPAGATEYQDILAAAKYLQNRNEVDAKKIGLLGGSYGGYLTAMGLARDSKTFAAGVDLHGVHDWSLRAKLRGPE
ncbi:MAG: S9 family peptidase, partial [Acidobacteriota bacterium]